MGTGTLSLKDVAPGMSQAHMEWGGVQTRPIFLSDPESAERARRGVV
jgi:hypothetical protein